MSVMRAVQVGRPGGGFDVVQRPIPQPQAGQVRVKVAANGICHSDAFVKEGFFPGTGYPRIPGHEIVGHIDQIGPGVSAWKVEQRVGIGWHGGHCFYCQPCRRGDFINCRNAKICGISYDGGYAEYVVVPQEALALVPDDISSSEAAPLLCAGITTYNALRHSGARGGDMVAVQGIGGLGHLGIQFAKKLGFKTIALSQGKEKEALVQKLGADGYIDTRGKNAAEELLKMGGARAILATAPDAKAISGLIDGLTIDGKLLVVGAALDPIEVSPFQLIMGRKSLLGWPSGTAKDSEDTLNFCLQTGIRPLVETFPLEKAAEAYDRMIHNQARFRVVLQMDH